MNSQLLDVASNSASMQTAPASVASHANEHKCLMFPAVRVDQQQAKDCCLNWHSLQPNQPSPTAHAPKTLKHLCVNKSTLCSMIGYRGVPIAKQCVDQTTLAAAEALQTAVCGSLAQGLLLLNSTDTANYAAAAHSRQHNNML